jgi:hypothetical protein
MDQEGAGIAGPLAIRDHELLARNPQMRRIVLSIVLLAPFASHPRQTPVDEPAALAWQLVSAHIQNGSCAPPIAQRETRERLAASLRQMQEPGLANPVGSSWVEFAVMSDDAGALGHLLALGYPLVAKDGNPLHGAALMSSPEMIRRLVELGVDPNGRTQRGATPLMVAAAENRLDLARELVTLGARADARAADGSPALHYAMFCHDQALVDFLLQAGAEVDDRARQLADRFQVRLP